MLADEFFAGTKQFGQKFIKLCQPMANYLGVTHVIYLLVSKEGMMFNLCTHPDWIERLLQEQYYKLDPLMVHPNNMHNGFFFDSASIDLEFKDTLLYDAVINFNWCHSFAYIEKIPSGGYFGFDFGTAKENHTMISRLVNETVIIKKMIRELHKKIMSLIENWSEFMMDFASLKGDLFVTQKGLVFNDVSEIKPKIKILNETGLWKGQAFDYDGLLTVSLSPQEIHCLRLYLEKRNLKKVAVDLGLALTTVSSYIENLKEKLHCYHKNDLLERGEILESLGKI